MSTPESDEREARAAGPQGHDALAELGEPADRTRGKVRDHMHPWVQEFISHSAFAVVATSGADGSSDASPRGGHPGFVKVLDDRHLLLPDIAGNRLFQSYSNALENPQVGLIFFVPGVDETARMNGRASRLDSTEMQRRGIELEVSEPDAKARVQQGLLIEVDEAFGHCPRAPTFSRLWDEEAIAAHRAERPLAKKPKGV